MAPEKSELAPGADARLSPEEGRAVIAKVAWRTVPLLGLLYVISYLDRVNIGFAALTMNKQLGISATVYGWAAGVFFFGYLLAQVPSNIMLVKQGPRRWMAFILLVWGLISMAMALVHDGASLIGARFLLGLAEAGFFPGVILYLTRWFPMEYRGRMVAGFMFGIPVSNMIGAPVSGLILKTLGDWHGLAGWQWLFIMESVPALLGALSILFLLPDRPQTAPWLTATERGWLSEQLALSAARLPPAKSQTKLATLKMGLSPKILILAMGYNALNICIYGVSLWLPQIVAQHGMAPLATGFISAVPYVFGAIFMILWGVVADRNGAGLTYLMIVGLLCGLALAASTISNFLPLQIFFLTLSTMGCLAGLSTFWAYSTKLLPASGVAIAIAAINSFGNLGGFLGPFLIGWVRDVTHSFQFGLLTVAAVSLLGTCLLPLTRPRKNP